MNQTAFDQVEPSARGHFRLHGYAALFRLHHFLHRLGVSEEALERFPFLQSYLSEIRPHLPPGLTWIESQHWWQQNLTAWEERCEAHLPLRAMGAALPWPDRLALMLAGLPEEDSRFGTLFAYLQAPLGQRRPTAELIGRIMEGVNGPHSIRPLVAMGLLEATNPGAPRSEWELAVPGPIWDLLRGEGGLGTVSGHRHTPPDELPTLEQLILAPELHGTVRGLPAAIQSGTVRTFILRGSPGSDRLLIAGAVARALGLGLLEVESGWERLGPLSTLSRSMPAFRCEPGPGESITLPELAGYTGPVAVLMGAEGGLRGSLADGAVTLHLPPPDMATRRRLWEAALEGLSTDDLEAIAERFHLPGGHIRQAAALARAEAALQQRERITLEDIRNASRALNRQALDALAVRLEPRGDWDSLVVSEGAMAKLLELERRCRHRERLLEQLGPLYTGRANRGVRALFGGPSGTGKTLAARTLASVLGMDIYRVDLAAVVNKYIGETEKNLNQLLTRAEELDVILLLDEGDALMARRSEVRSANDRYANLETNYLLQRLEQYQGIILITTNASDQIDPAFKRRLDVAVDFLTPQSQERFLIWQLHLPAPNGIDPAWLEEVASRCELNGGQIRNAAMHAALLAMDDGGLLLQRHLEAAVQTEYRKAGAICPLGEQGEESHGASGIDRFLTAVRGGGSTHARGKGKAEGQGGAW